MKSGILERQGDAKPFSYRQLDKIPLHFAKGEVSDLVYKIFREIRKPLSIDEITTLVQIKRMNLEEEKQNAAFRSRSKFRNVVRTIVARWYRDGALALVSEGSFPLLYELKPHVVERPVNVVASKKV